MVGRGGRVASPGTCAFAGHNTQTHHASTNQPHQHTEASGLRIYELEEGRGRAVALGDTVSVHFDCLYRGIDAVSSRYARTLGGNRTVAEPLEFVAGEAVSGSLVKAVGESGGGGLFSGTPGPKPPQAVSRAVVGMKPGGRVRSLCFRFVLFV